MIHPLIDHTQGASRLKIYRQAVLAEHRQSVSRDKLGDTVIYLGINVVRTSCKDNSEAAALTHLGEQARSLSSNILLCSLLLFPSARHRRLYF